MGRFMVATASLLWVFGAVGGQSAVARLFSDAQICRAGIAAMNGNDPVDLKVRAAAGNVVTLRYRRPSDGKTFLYNCRLEREQIRWHDQSMPYWNSNLRLAYRLLEPDGKRIEIHSWVRKFDDTREYTTFTLEQLKNSR